MATETSKTKKILAKKEPERSLIVPLKKKGGRSRTGRITVRHRGGGMKRKYRLVEFGQPEMPLKMKVLAIEYDPNRTCFIALVSLENGRKAYILAPDGMKVGDEIVYSENAPIERGNRLKLKNIPIGTDVYNVELVPGKGGKIARAAGNSCQIMGEEGKYVLLRMPSGEIRKVLGECFASIGQLSNPQHRFEEIGKAGRKRWMGIRPTVRGSAMTPADHPHGGGEGKTPIGLKFPKTPWGKPARGVKTRNKKKWTSKLIIERRKKNK